MSDANAAESAQDAVPFGSQSPISQLLITLGMTREDLTRHSAQMREFLTAESSRLPRPLLQSTIITRTAQTILQHTSASFAATAVSNHPTSTRTTSQPHTARTPPLEIADRPARSPKNFSRSSSNGNFTRKSSASVVSDHRRERRQLPQATSPSRHKPNLDEIMRLRSRNSKREVEPEDSDSSDEGPIDLYSSRLRSSTRASPFYHQPYYSQQATSSKTLSSREPQSASKYYRVESPTVSAPGGNYYRNYDGSSNTPLTPTSHSNQRQRRAPTITPTRPKPAVQIPAQNQQLNSRSSPAPSSPIRSSPNFRVHMASSPGPLASSPAKQTDAELPFVLPPGPYSDEKPDLSYAALIGRAILASPEHKLRLKDIYDYISIVFPYFKRNGHSHGQKWMNAIRQNLTNTPQFHKSGAVDPVTKSSYWCIKDSDLPCFANGGYNRHALNPYGMPLPGARADKRKRKEENGETAAKKARILPPMPQTQPPNPYHFPYGYPQMPMHYPVPGRPIYVDQSRVRADVVFPPLPPSHPNAHMVNRMPPETEHVIFPPLPASSQTRIAREARLKEQAQQLESNTNAEIEEEMEEEEDLECCDANKHDSITPPPIPSSDTSLTSVPDLTSNDSSSSPVNDTPTYECSAEPEQSVEVGVVAEEEDMMNMIIEEPQIIHHRISASDKGKARAIEVESEDDENLRVPPQLPAAPSTPTRSRTIQARKTSTSRISFGFTDTVEREHQKTPPKTNVLMSAVSLVKTPTSSKNPPSTPRGNVRFSVSENSDDKQFWGDALPRTPARGKGNPVTPKGIFSPFTGFSPYRTPSRRFLVDPSDPSALLDEELSALASASQRQAMQDSPVGFFGHGRGLLYESPNIPSPSRWRPW